MKLKRCSCNFLYIFLFINIFANHSSLQGYPTFQAFIVVRLVLWSYEPGC